MNNTKNENQKSEKEKKNVKTCAILYPITSFLWFLVAGLNLYTTVSAGKPISWLFWTQIAVAVVFGCIAIDYIIKYRKQKKEDEAEVKVIG